MKKCCAGLAVVLVSLAAFGIASAQQDFHGVIDPNTYDVIVDSAIIVTPSLTETVDTPGWSADSVGVDTFNFPDLPEWPTRVTLMSRIAGRFNLSPFASPVRDIWYNFALSGMFAPKAKFFGAGGAVEESRPALERRQCLNVSPSVVTAQMTVRVQPAGPGRPVVAVLDAAGNLIRSLNCTAGANGLATATWNREDGLGHLVPGGVYFCRYAASGAVAVRKVLVAH